jgi:uroporphyrin-III C-methyltransferase/precorrin-2 dehydrogenase/sirohydrochlorin ferrochelatase
VTTLLGIDLAGRRVLVVGGGPMAARRAQLLLREGATVRLVAPEVCEDILTLVEEGHVSWRVGTVREQDLDGVWLVHTASGDRAVDAVVADWADARRIWCVNAGEVGRGSARTPAVTRTEDIVVGVVSSGSADPGRTLTVRDALAEHLRAGGADLRRRRPAAPGTGRVILVGGGPGSVDLLTLRGRRALSLADVVVTDRLGPSEVLEELPVDVEVIDVGKTPGHHAVPQYEINQILVDHALRGRVVVRLKGGDPFVYGRGGEEVIACREAGVEVEVVPGVSSVLAVPAAAGIPLTHRGTTASYHVINGHSGLDAAARLVIRDKSATLVILMGVTVLADLVADALSSGADPTTPVAIIENGTTALQRVTRDRLDMIVGRAREVGIGTPAVIVIGDVAAPGLLSGNGGPRASPEATISS